MVRFEYRIIDLSQTSKVNPTLEAMLNVAGQQGWELVKINDLNQGIFKRPLEQNRTIEGAAVVQSESGRVRAR